MSNQQENIDIESLNPELIQKLYEFVNSENPLSKLLNQDISVKASPKSSSQELDSQQQM
jgi:hypothetical protein